MHYLHQYLMACIVTLTLEGHIHQINLVFGGVKHLFYSCVVEGEILLLHLNNNQKIPPNELFVICSTPAL